MDAARTKGDAAMISEDRIKAQLANRTNKTIYLILHNFFHTTTVCS